ncbi:phosphatases II [Ceratobasidium sp. AG-I]|nr:phosphatases II [Ceratobasidium sp. AG-I]
MESIKIAKVDRVILVKGGVQQTGTLHLTAHHLIFHENEEQETWIPYPLISLVTRLPQTLVGHSPISVRCRTFENFSLYFEKDQDALDVFDSVRESTVATSVTKLYAFFYQPPPGTPQNGWSAFTPREEFARMGLGTRTKAWRLTDINKDYTFCPTYPAILVVPARISDATLAYAAKYRSKARIPALSYLHWGNFATITRCSQPMVGLTNNRSVQDEKLIEAIFQSHHSAHSVYAGPPDGRARSTSSPVYGATTVNLIIDARPTTNAMANAAKGAGTENMENYKEAKKVYLGIDNIHVMRDSLAKVAEALYEADMAASISASGSPLADASKPDLPRPSFLDRQTLRRSGWLRHLSAILEGTAIIVKNIHVYSSHALLHCSDGWDRTAQLSSLAQICLDPYFRTISGFSVLVEKEWLSYGHKFLDRCGHLSSDKLFVVAPNDNGSGGDAAQAFFASVQNKFSGQSHLKETSPVFHQFLESLWQILRQHPTRFEYNEEFLVKVHYHLNSCQFGTFLFNCERDRRVSDGHVLPADQRTHSIWDWIDANRSQWLNAQYDPAANGPTSRDMGVLVLDTKDVRFWHRLYGRGDEEMNGGAVANQIAGVELRGPVAGVDDDPVLAGSPLLALTPSTTPPPTSDSDSVNLAKRIPYQPRSPTRPRKQTPGSPFGGSASPPGVTRQDSFRPFASTNSAYSMQPGTNDASSRGWKNAAEGLAVGAGVKSVWASISSNASTAASTAFSAVQAAYDNTTRESSPLAESTSRHNDILSTGGELPTVSRLGSLGRNSNQNPLAPSASVLNNLGNPWLDEPSAEPLMPVTKPIVSPTPIATSTPKIRFDSSPRPTSQVIAPLSHHTTPVSSPAPMILGNSMPSLSNLTLESETSLKPTRSATSPTPLAKSSPAPAEMKPRPIEPITQTSSDIDPLGVGFK